jgi:hypothetical protein
MQTPKEKKDPWQYNCMVENFQERFGPRMGLFLANRMARAIVRCGDLCLDNFRVARKNKLLEVLRYENAKSSGC